MSPPRGPFLFFPEASFEDLANLFASRLAGFPVHFLSTGRNSWILGRIRYSLRSQAKSRCIFPCSQEREDERWILIPAHVRESSPTLNCSKTTGSICNQKPEVVFL
jgi:hypothetical protein